MAVVQVERGFHIVMVYGDGVVDERESWRVFSSRRKAPLSRSEINAHHEL